NVLQDACTMKVNTDGVLLGAWATVDKVHTILDIGTGTGVIALMLAQRFEGAMIHAVEIHEATATQAKVNFAQSIWADRMQVFQSDFVSLFESKEQLYDLIVSNPPYFNNSLLSPNSARNMARHTCNLSYDDLLKGTSKLLSEQGHFCVILPSSEERLFCEKAVEHQLFLSRKMEVANTKSSSVKRVLLDFSKHKIIRLCSEFLTIRDAESKLYSEDYKKLTQDFYLQF
ncbi:MAG: tRNA1(Val) (adenine(37)-N6)-methyltransferase, partial [Bacteroidales bacterium]